MIPKVARLFRYQRLLSQQNRNMGVYYKSGALKAMPPVNAFGILGVFCTMIPGILLGAIISKNIASFLEENDLFVPEDEDDD
ncbi:unnamed protein product [Chironomus riparius]|uniref:Essential MCU regulator, mitochondrial n=1 Tax=Chironomus riparius TaxID=315576 RepID=A0A9N9WWH5_9DIPT|nr:unnamed protein product [Chironomus riparius]